MRITVPPGACDTHMHFYDRRYPASETAWLFPPDFLLPDYRAMQARTGLSRMIVVQPVTYGFDNRCILDNVAAIGDAARAVVTVRPDITDEALADLWARGARGLRYHQMKGSMTEWADVPRMAERIAGSGWHLQIQFDGMEFPDHAGMLAALPCTIVIDHMGRYSQAVTPDHPAVTPLLDLARQDNVWVKLSGAYHVSRSGGPDYADVAPIARALVAQGTGRLLWGSDWPHPTEAPEHMPDDALLLDLLADWTDSQDQVDAILSHNPARLYGY